MNNQISVFEIATRQRFRYPYRGWVSTEDLWTLPVSDLDTIFKALNSQLKQAKEESLLQVRTPSDKVLDMKIQIVKYIFDVKQADEQAKIDNKKKREQKQKIMELIASKQDSALEAKSVDELQKMLDELDK